MDIQISEHRTYAGTLAKDSSNMVFIINIVIGIMEVVAETLIIRDDKAKKIFVTGLFLDKAFV